MDLACLSFDGIDDELAKQEKGDRIKFISRAVDDPQSLERMLRNLEFALDALRSITTIDQMAAFCTRREHNPMPFEVCPYLRMRIAVATGNFD